MSDDKKERGANPKAARGDRKPPVHAVPAAAIVRIARGLKEGWAEYGKYNWRTTRVLASTYLDGAMRHLLAFQDGEDIDPESKTGKHHLDGALASLAILVDALDGGFLDDDRPPPGPGPRLLRDPRFQAQADAEGPYSLTEIERAIREAGATMPGQNTSDDAVEAVARALSKGRPRAAVYSDIPSAAQAATEIFGRHQHVSECVLGGCEELHRAHEPPPKGLFDGYACEERATGKTLHKCQPCRHGFCTTLNGCAACIQEGA